MDIKLVSFADKVTGATDATGKVSADDVNQLKKILNAIVSALFPLDSSNTATSAVIKSLALPAVDIFEDFNPGDFTVSNGLISLANGTSLPVPPPLTNGLVDDSADTFTATLPAGYAATDLERTFDSGTTWAAITALPLSVGNIAFAVGQVGLRVKANSERQHSATLFNQSAFTVAGGSGTSPDNGFAHISVTGFVSNNAIFNEPSPNENTFHFHNAADGGNSYDSATAVISAAKIPAGQAGIVRFSIDTTTAGFFIGLDPHSDDTAGGNNSMLICSNWSRASNTSGNFTTCDRVTNPGNTSYHGSGSLTNLAVPPRFQYRCTGSRIYAEYSTDGGTTWTDIAPSTPITQPNSDLYIHLFGIGDTGKLVNIIQTGMVNA